MSNHKIIVDVHVEKDGSEYYAYAPALKGLHVGGSTIDEVLKNAEDGIVLYLESLIERGEPFPEGPHFKIRDYIDSLAKVKILWSLQMMLGGKSETSKPKSSYAH